MCTLLVYTSIYNFCAYIICGQCPIQPPKLCIGIIYLPFIIYTTLYCCIFVHCQAAVAVFLLRSSSSIIAHTFSAVVAFYIKSYSRNHFHTNTNAFNLHTNTHTHVCQPTCIVYIFAIDTRDIYVCAVNVHVIVTLASRTSIPIGWVLDFYLPIYWWRDDGNEKRRKVKKSSHSS